MVYTYYNDGTVGNAIIVLILVVMDGVHILHKFDFMSKLKES